MGPTEGLELIRRAYLAAATFAVELLHDPAVAASWNAPSALREFAVSGLAGHLARQIFQVSGVLAQDPPDERPITLLEHYTGSRWLAADLDDEVNVRIRRDGEKEAADGQAALAGRARAAVDELREALPAQAPGRVVYVPWGPWALSLDDFLVTRMLEIAVHNDDLAVSVAAENPRLPPAVIDPVIALLSQLAVHRHGATAVLRALSRAERAPATIAAI